MTWFIDGVRVFLFGPPQQKPEPFTWPDWIEAQRPTGCDYCGMEKARCGRGRYGTSPIARAIPRIIAFEEALTVLEVNKMRRDWGEFFQATHNAARGQ
jgi:hypothetical protein